MKIYILPPGKGHNDYIVSISGIGPEIRERFATAQEAFDWLTREAEANECVLGPMLTSFYPKNGAAQ